MINLFLRVRQTLTYLIHSSCPSSNSVMQRALEAVAQLPLGALDAASGEVFVHTCVRRRVRHYCEFVNFTSTHYSRSFFQSQQPAPQTKVTVWTLNSVRFFRAIRVAFYHGRSTVATAGLVGTIFGNLFSCHLACKAADTTIGGTITAIVAP